MDEIDLTWHVGRLECFVGVHASAASWEERNPFNCRHAQLVLIHHLNKSQHGSCHSIGVIHGHWRGCGVSMESSFKFVTTQIVSIKPGLRIPNRLSKNSSIPCGEYDIPQYIYTFRIE